MSVLVTGSSGFIGRRVVQRLAHNDGVVREFDLPASVLDRHAVRDASEGMSACIHLAAHKHAPYGEESPAEVAELNIVGTRNVVEVFGPNVVLASTCKAADPMTAYGASKLIAERIVLNAGGKVIRFVNVLGSTGSVLDTWKQIPVDDPIPVVDGCRRMWICPAEAVDLLVGALGWPSGRYAPDIVSSVPMLAVARKEYPNRTLSIVPPRRGDRPTERLVAEYEWAEPWQGDVMRICHPADIVVEVSETRSP